MTDVFYFYLKFVCYCRKHPSQGKNMGTAGAKVLFLLCVEMRQKVYELASYTKVAPVIHFVVLLNILTPN